MPEDKPQENATDEFNLTQKRQKMLEIEQEIEKLKNALSVLKLEIEEIERKIKEEKIKSQLPS